MQSLLAQLNNLFETVPYKMQRSWIAVLIFIFGITIFMVYSIADRFVMELSHELWFEKGAQPLLDRDLFRTEFGSDEDLFIVYQPNSGDVFSKSALETLKTLHSELEAASISQNNKSGMGKVVDVDSLMNARYQIAEGDTLISQKLIGTDFPGTEADREKRRIIADSQDNFQRVFYSKDYQYGAIRLKTSFGVEPENGTQMEILFSEESSLLEDNPMTPNGHLSPELTESDFDEVTTFKNVQLEDYVAFMSAVKAITGQTKYENFTFYFVGNPANQDFTMGIVTEASLLLLMMVLIVSFLLFVLFRSFSAVIWPLIIVVMATTWGIGLASWIVTSFSTLIVMAIMLVIAVSIAGCVHIFSTYLHFRNEGHGHDSAISKSYRKTGLAIFLTSITTMSAMLTLAGTDMPLIQTFGWVAGFSVAFCFVLLVTIFPLMMNLWRPELRHGIQHYCTNGKKLTPASRIMLSKVADFTERYPKHIIIGYIIFFVVLSYGVIILKVDSNFAKVAREGSELQVSVNLVDEKLMGGLNLEIFLDFNKADALKDPEVLKALDDLQQSLRTQFPDKVIKSVSLSNIVKDTHRVMNEGNQSFYTIPDDPRLAAQLLYLFNNANSTDRRELVSDDYSKSHISFMLRNAGSYEYQSFYDGVQTEIERLIYPLHNRYPDMDIRLTGISHLMMKISDHIVWSELQSFGFALLSVTIIMMLTLGSMKTGLIAIIPNLLPALFVFGIMGYLGIALNGELMLVAPVIIGIAVDDTIHFLTYYRNAWFKTGNVAKAVRSTIEEVGTAVSFTTLILALGFGVLGFSSHLGLAKPGIAGAIAIIVALLSDLLFLPALLHWLKPNLGRKHATQ